MVQNHQSEGEDAGKRDGSDTEFDLGDELMMRPKKPCRFGQRKRVFSEKDSEKLLEGIRPYLEKAIKECKTYLHV